MVHTRYMCLTTNRGDIMKKITLDIELFVIAGLFGVLPLCVLLFSNDPDKVMAIYFLEFMYCGPVIGAVIGIIRGMRAGKWLGMVVTLVVSEAFILFITKNIANIVVIRLALLPILTICIGWGVGRGIGYCVSRLSRNKYM